MNRSGPPTISICLLAAALLAPASHVEGREVIDRIVAVIDHKDIVTASDIQKERLILTALRQPVPEDSVILQQLIDRRLVEDQVAQMAKTTPELNIAEADLEDELANLQNPIAAGNRDVREYIRQQLRLTRYRNRRFRQFIRLTQTEKEQYYNDVVLAEARRNGLTSLPKLEDPEIDAVIEYKLIEEKINREVATALEALRGRSDVELFLP